MTVEMGAILFRRAIEIGFHRLTTAELEQIARYEETELGRLVVMKDGLDKETRRALHRSILELAVRTASRRRP